MLATVALLAALAACGDDEEEPSRPQADLSALAVARVTVADTPFEVWIADTPATRQRGLMHATEEQLAPLSDGTARGMLFVYPEERLRAFFMRDTFVPLDLAYADASGTITEVHALVPLDETPVRSAVPARFALEVRAGTLAASGLGVGDRIVFVSPRPAGVIGDRVAVDQQEIRQRAFFHHPQLAGIGIARAPAAQRRRERSAADG